MPMERSRTHPILLAAGAAVLLFSLLGAAALTGILPVGNSKTADFGPLAQKAAAAAPAAHPSQRMAAAPCTNCGIVESVRAVEAKGSGSGVGAVAGGVAGGVLGNQIGHGGTRTLLTIGGAAGGAYAGNEIERNLNRHTVWRVAVRLEDGSLRTLSQRSQPPFAVGDRVRIVDGAVERA
jgi:outer membrane lipoprotein SlyB